MVSSSNGNKSNTVILTEDILPNDTLQSFSLRYGCSINDIKRANGLIKEQDFYALKTIKIPVSRYSLLTVPEEKQRHREIYDQFYSQDTASTSSSALISTSIDSDVKRSFETILPSHADSSDKSSQNTSPEIQSSSEFDSSESLEETASLLVQSNRPKRVDAADKNDTNSYLKKLDKDIRKTVKKADIGNDKTPHNESLNEVLSSIQFYPSEQTMPPPNRVKKTNGADCGLKWWSVILCFFLILLIIIILAVFEYYRSK
uniref:lysM and putative peptidoglycan-binding domain-containing protein 3-like n=1 Tax=Styela clava TaxID=7725 RepID=UPI00193ABF84|nr:lysM and putative peptidoglycan-binding domain-containing protein 3-like [Styela clava]